MKRPGQQDDPDSVMSRSNSLATGLTKLRRGSTKLRILGTAYEKDTNGSPLSSINNTGNRVVRPETAYGEENTPKNDGRRFARIMHRRASRLKMLQELEREKRKGETLKAAWTEQNKLQREKSTQKAAESALQQNVLNRVKTPLERLRSHVRNNKNALQLAKKVDMMEEASKAEEERHRAELEGFKEDITEELTLLRDEKDELAQKLLEAENAPAEVRRQMTEELRVTRVKLAEKQMELEKQRAEVHKELVQIHELEKQKIVAKHTQELEAMHQALDNKERELSAQNLTRQELTTKVDNLNSQRNEIEKYLETQKEAALASQGQQMAKEHLKELHTAEARLTQREYEMQMERDRLEAKLSRMQDSSEGEKVALRRQLERMQEQLLQNEADLRSHKQEVSEDIEEEMQRLAEMKEKTRSTDNLAMSRLTELLGAGGNNQTSLQKLKKETTDSKALLLGQEDAKQWMQANQVGLLTPAKSFGHRGDNGGRGSEHVGLGNDVDDVDDVDEVDDLMSIALAGLGGGDEGTAEGIADDRHNKDGEEGIKGLQRNNISGVKRLRLLVAQRMGGLKRFTGAAEHRKRKEAELVIENEAQRGKLLNELTKLKQKREHLLATAEVQGITTPLGQQTASTAMAVDADILNKSMRLEQLQRNSQDDRSNPLKKFRSLVSGNKARIAALATASNMTREVLLEPERRAREKVIEKRHRAEDSEHHLEELAQQEEMLLSQSVDPEVSLEDQQTSEQKLIVIRNERAQVEKDVLKMEADAEDAIELAAGLSRTRIEKDHEPLRMLRKSLASRWEVERDAVRILRRQQQERMDKLEVMKRVMLEQLSKIQGERTLLKAKVQQIERVDGPAGRDSSVLQQKRAIDTQEMDLQRDRKELESRLRREAKESQEMTAEVAIRMKIADSVIGIMAVAERLDTNEREETVLKQEIKLLKVSATDEAETEVQRKLETLQRSIEHLRKERLHMKQEVQTLERHAQKHVQNYDRQLESRIQAEKTNVAHGKSVMKRVLMDVNPEAKASAEALISEEGKLERLQEDMVERNRSMDEDRRRRTSLDRKIEQEQTEIREITKLLVSTNPTGRMIAEKVWVQEEKIDRLETRAEEQPDNTHDSTRKKLEERIIEESNLLSSLQAKLMQVVASDPSARMSSTRLHQMEGNLGRLRKDRRTMVQTAKQHRKKRRDLNATIAKGKVHVTNMENVLFNTNPGARAAADSLHQEEEKLLRLQEKRASLATQAEADLEARKNLTKYEQDMRRIEATEGVIIVEEDLQVRCLC